MRITFDRINANLSAINTSLEQFARAKQQVETGRRLSVPSDDPAAMRRTVEGHAEVAHLDAYGRTSSAVAARQAVMDSVLTDVVDQLTEALTAATSARGSTVAQPTRDAAALKLAGIRDAIVADLNTSFQGARLFSGTESNTAAYTRVGGVWTYGGNASAATMEVAPGRVSATTVDGRAIAQGADATDILTEIDTLIASIQAADDVGVGNGIAALERAFTRATTVQTRLGIDMQALEEGRQQVVADRLAASKRLSSDEDTNMAAAITEMSQADTAYRAALQATSLSARVSLLDYLR